MPTSVNGAPVPVETTTNTCDSATIILLALDHEMKSPFASAGRLGTSPTVREGPSALSLRDSDGSMRQFCALRLPTWVLE